MKNKYILLTIISMIIAGGVLIDYDIHATGICILAVGLFLLATYPLVCDFINNK